MIYSIIIQKTQSIQTYVTCAGFLRHYRIRITAFAKNALEVLSDLRQKHDRISILTPTRPLHSVLITRE